MQGRTRQFIAAANVAHIPIVLHRVASMASGGMDTLPHNGAVITLLLVCGLTHKQSYKDIFTITCIKTIACFVIIGVYYIVPMLTQIGIVRQRLLFIWGQRE